MRHRHNYLRLHTPIRRAKAGDLVKNLITHEQIRTTLANARVTTRVANHMVRLGKIGTLASRRKALSMLGDGPHMKKLFDDLGKRYAKRPGGVTRLMRMLPRKGDGAPMAIVELVDRVPKPIATDGKGKKAEAKADTKAASAGAAKA